MEIKFPEQQDSFPKTFATAVVSCLVALIIGMFLGNAMGAFLGMDESILNTSTYTDNMAAVKTLFTDPDQSMSFMDTAQQFLDMDGLKLYSSKNGNKMLAYYQGQYYDADEFFDEQIKLSLTELTHTDDALYGQETTAGTPIEGIQLWNLAVEDNVVYYYLYYDEAGYIGIAYDHTESVLPNSEYAMQLTATMEGVQGIWYIIYYMED